VQIEYDEVADAAYLRLRPGPLADSRELAGGIIADYDYGGRLAGVEILGAGAYLQDGRLVLPESVVRLIKKA